jgi:hypothetical protein
LVAELFGGSEVWEVVGAAELEGEGEGVLVAGGRGREVGRGRVAVAGS